jgi:hypothetical protein
MTIIQCETTREALDIMNSCIRFNYDRTLRGLDKRRNAELYVLARDSAMALGADINNYPRSIGETESQFSQSNLSEILGRIL